MSIEAVTYVLKHSEATLGARLVLISLANYAHDDGSQSFPSVETVVRHSRMTRRAVQAALRKLEADGHIKATGKRPSGTTVYQIVGLGGAETAPGVPDAAGGVAHAAGGVVDAADMSSTTPDPYKNRGDNRRESTEAVRLFDEANATVADVLGRLNWLADNAGTAPVSTEALLTILEAFPTVDAKVEVEEFVFWAVHGNGSRRQIKSIAGTFRNWMRRVAESPSSGKTSGSSVQSGGERDWNASVITGE